MGYMKSGFKRSVRDKKKRLIKSHVREYYEILEKLEDTAWDLYRELIKDKEVEITEQWVKENAPAYIGRELDHLEVMIVASKIWELQRHNKVDELENGESN